MRTPVPSRTHFHPRSQHGFPGAMPSGPKSAPCHLAEEGGPNTPVTPFRTTGSAHSSEGAPSRAPRPSHPPAAWLAGTAGLCTQVGGINEGVTQLETLQGTDMRTRQSRAGWGTPLPDSKLPAPDHQELAETPLPPKVSGKRYPCPHLLKNLSQGGKGQQGSVPGPLVPTNTLLPPHLSPLPPASR